MQQSISGTSSSTEYQYRPLEEDDIRVLLLFDGAFDSPLCAELVHVPIPRFEALSYVWGDQGDPETLHILHGDDSSADFSTLQIGQNLASALRALRLETGYRVLWCDAVCINQNDLQERATQVKRMASIFKKANRVIFWLGPESKDTSRAMQILRDHAMPASPPPPLSDEDWGHLNTFLGLPWFERLWIRQEVSLASNSSIFKSGTHEIDWVTFHNGITYFRHYVLDQPTSDENSQIQFWQNLERAFDIVMGKKHRSFILGTLIMASRCSCTDQRDKVYGVLGTQDDFDRLDIEPDYAMKTPQDVYFDLTTEHLKFSSTSNILPQCEMADSSSWVPDYSKPVPQLGMLANGFASGQTKAFYDILPDNSLSILATFCGTITRRTSTMPSEPSLRVIQSTLSSWVCDTYPQGVKTCDSSNIDDFFTTLASGLLHEDKGADYSPTTLEAKNSLFRGVEGYSPEGPSEHDMASFWGRYSGVRSGHALFTTDRGSFALGTGEAREGDEIYVILGCDFPIILRSAGNLKHTIIGPCFMHSLMRAEALLGPLPEGWRIQFIPPHGFTQLIDPNGCFAFDDPRLQELSPDWLMAKDEDGLSYWKQTSGEEDHPWTNFDPRMTPDHLRARGVKLESLTII